MKPCHEISQVCRGLYITKMYCIFGMFACFQNKTNLGTNKQLIMRWSIQYSWQLLACKSKLQGTNVFRFTQTYLHTQKGMFRKSPIGHFILEIKALFQKDYKSNFLIQRKDCWEAEIWLLHFPVVLTEVSAFMLNS